MFKSKALWGCFLFVLSTVAASTFVDDEIEAVVIEASHEDTSSRSGRQLLLPVLPVVRIGALYPSLQQVVAVARSSCTTNQNTTGTCMTINECHPTWKVFRTPAQESWAYGLYNTCSYDTAEGTQIVGVCCPNDNTDERSFADDSVLDGSEETMNEEKKEKSKKLSRQECLLTSHQKNQISNSQCTNYNSRTVDNNKEFLTNITTWKVPASPFVTRLWRYKRAVSPFNSPWLLFPRIVGGKPIQPNQFKFVAALLTEDYQGRTRQFCGGSVIDEYHVLTAAHCVASYTEDDVRRLRVHLGAHNIHSNAGKSMHKVDRIIRHIDFSQRTLDNDVAILTLNTPAPINSHPNVKQVCLPAGSSTYYNTEAIVAGWGSLKFGGGQPNVLHMVKVKVWQNQVCASNYGGDAPGGITARMMCAANPGRDSCQGDSGGALFQCNGPDDCTQIGIVSWGISCADPKYPGVYTRVTQMMEWIKRITSCY